MVRIPDQEDDDKRRDLEEQFNSEVAFLSRLYHPNIVQVSDYTILRTSNSLPYSHACNILYVYTVTYDLVVRIDCWMINNNLNFPLHHS